MKTPSVQPVLRSKLLPRISFKMMFALTTLAAFFAAIARVAGNGGELASAAVAAVCFLLACFTVYVLAFLVARLAATFRYATVLAMVVMVVALIAMQAAGFRMPTTGNLPVIFFLLIVAAALRFTPQRKPDVHSPFAEGQLPPQILPPREGPQ